MRIVISGSMSKSKEMVEIKNILEKQGHKVLIPVGAEKYASGKLKFETSKKSIENKIKKDLIKGHYSLIEGSDSVLIANYDKNGIKNYIGGNSFLEAGFAHILDKKLYFLNDIPEMSYSDELKAFQPIILNGDLTKIK